MMTQTFSSGKGQPAITITKDGPGWSTITLNGAPILGGWCRGKRAEALREAEYRLKVWQAGNLPAPSLELLTDEADWLETSTGQAWLEQEAARFEPVSLSKYDDPAYFLGRPS